MRFKQIVAWLCFLLAVLMPVDAMARENVGTPEIDVENVEQAQYDSTQSPELSSAPLEETGIPVNCRSALLVEPMSGQVIFEKTPTSAGRWPA